MEKPTILFAMTLLAVMNQNFGVDAGSNPNSKRLTNAKGNMVWVVLNNDSVVVSAYKVSARCLKFELATLDDIPCMIESLTSKLKLTINNSLT